jgi:transcriptional regulator with PAS, ATPase and Fis domain
MNTAARPFVTLHLQVRLLRVLETAAVTRVGGQESLAIDVRVLATGLGVEGAVAASKLGEDLFYRFIPA